MEERLENWTRDARPIGVVILLEFPSRSLFHDLQEPAIQWSIGRETLQHAHKAQGLVLEIVDLEALMIEAVNGILETPLAGTFVEESSQLVSA